MDEFDSRVYIGVNEDSLLENDSNIDENTLMEYYKLKSEQINIHCKLSKYSKIIFLFQNIKTNNWQELLEHLEEKYAIFLAIYDTSKGGVNFNFKTLQLFVINTSNDNNKETIRNIIFERLENLTKIIPKEIFIKLGLKIYSYEEFCNTPIESLLNEMRYYYKILDKYFVKIITIIELMIHINNKCIAFTNPKKIIICDKQT